MNSLIVYYRSLLHLFFPYCCCGCGREGLSEESLFCIYCEAGMPLTQFELFHSNLIERNFWGRIDLQSACAHLYFTSGSSVQRSLHLLKYKGRTDIGISYGRRMATALKSGNRFETCDMIIPLPLFRSREKKRGYNQAKILSEGLSQILRIPVVSDAVIRVRKTETQTHKSRIERWKNMESTFRITDPQKIAGKHILLVDDVITTGATLEACAQVLLQVPDVRVSIACLACTVTA